MPDASPKDAAKDGAERDYKNSLFLPETDFPMRAGLPKAEPELLKRWARDGLYARLRADAKGRPSFVLHDGPPYANGHIHLGTALTKILKDMIVRSRQMAGFDANYVPGWDCHGLPIEWKVEEEFRAKGRAKKDIPSSEFRAACRAYAQKWLDIQREEFKRLGGEGDWANPYTTMAFSSEAAIAAELLKFADLGLLYRGSKPVMWSPVEQTALAEAEIEYHDHVSPTIWVKFPVKRKNVDYIRKRLTSRWDKNQQTIYVNETPYEQHTKFLNETDDRQIVELDVDSFISDMTKASVVIWTTTPWTIPGNRAICFNPRMTYGLYEVTQLERNVPYKHGIKVGERYIVSVDLAGETFGRAPIATTRLIAQFSGYALEGFVCSHPCRGYPRKGAYDFDVPMLGAEHVTNEQGTGFVHTAPGHGQEDYAAWIADGRSHADIPHTVDEFGAFTDEAPGFTGKKVLITEGKKAGEDGDANRAVIDALIEKGALLARGRLTHSYPHSWRSKAPVIFRNTPQWFIALDRPTANGKTLRENALAAIDATGFTPPTGRNRLRSMVESRPDWLVSRQRAWGVPLTIFVEKATGKILRDKAVDERILKAIALRGADAWFDAMWDAHLPTVHYFLGENRNPADYEKIDDILDVWFDSGSTHAFVLEGRDDLSWPADVYCEGSDQHRGWFQSSLLESCGTRGAAPYRHIVTNGFVVDQEGRKMSKSLGNVVAPEEIIRNFGAEMIRIWVASADYTEDPRIGKEIIDSAVDAYRKLRNTVRYLIGALNGFEPAERVGVERMPEIERYMLCLMARLDDEVRAAYAAFDFKVVWRKVFDFCALDLSAFYLDIRKDSLYCDHARSDRRRAARTVMEIAFDRLTAWLAPICVFTMEEAWLNRNGEDARSVHLRQFPETPAAWRNDALAERWETLRRIRRVVTGAIEIERRDKRIGASLEAAPTLYLTDDALLDAVKDRDLAELFITSDARIEKGEGPASAFRGDDAPSVAVVVAVSAHKKCQRCWRYTDDVGSKPAHPDACGRCADAVDMLEKAR